MAGNTKLIGFDSDKKSVDLERWGGKVKIDIGETAVSRLRAACYTILPKAPVQRPHGSSDGFDADYNRDYGKIELSLSPDVALTLADILRMWNEDGSVASAWIKELERTHQEHVEYTDITNEPGVE